MLLRRCACHLPPAAAAAVAACGWGPRLPPQGAAPAAATCGWACGPSPPLPSAPRRRAATAAAAIAAAESAGTGGGSADEPARRRIDGLPVVYHPLYSAPTLVGPGGTPHRFPMAVFRRIYERLLAQGIVPFTQVHVPPSPWPSQEQLLRVRRCFVFVWLAFCAAARACPAPPLSSAAARLSSAHTCWKHPPLPPSPHTITHAKQ